MEGTKTNEPKPDFKKPRQASLNMYVLCVHLSSQQTPTSLEQASAAAATYAVPKWLAALTATVT